jgi:hypothetical protein
MFVKRKRRVVWIIMDGLFDPPKQGGFMAGLTNVRSFPKPEPLSKLDQFLLKYGAKEMTPKKESASPLEWNKSVLGLVATLLTVLGIFAAVLVSYATLSADFRNYQKVTDEKMQKMEQKMEKIEDWQRQDSLQKAKVQGYQLGATETKQKEEK